MQTDCAQLSNQFAGVTSTLRSFLPIIAG